MQLYDCEAGWIHMTLSTLTTSVSMRLSECFDPIPNFIYWMEALLTEVMCCGFVIDEEGTEKYFSARTRWKGRYLLTVTDGEFEGAEELLKAVVHRRQLIETIYRGFQHFGKSADYVAREWELKTLGERIALQTGTTLDQMADFLEKLDEDSLYRFFHAVLPATHSVMPQEVERFSELKQLLAFAQLPNNSVVAESILNCPEAWKLTRPVEFRRSEILEFLNVQASMFGGTPLDSLHSEVLERYLASDRDPL